MLLWCGHWATEPPRKFILSLSAVSRCLGGNGGEDIWSILGTDMTHMRLSPSMFKLRARARYVFRLVLLHLWRLWRGRDLDGGPQLSFICCDDTRRGDSVYSEDLPLRSVSEPALFNSSHGYNCDTAARWGALKAVADYTGKSGRN
jgi:hypothetical protein